jgi:hypothetical protein
MGYERKARDDDPIVVPSDFESWASFAVIMLGVLSPLIAGLVWIALGGSQ